MRRFFGYCYKKVYDNIIKPVLESVSPIEEASLGMAIGMFVGLTPTVGIQMWIVFMIWMVFRFIFRLKFDLIIGTAVVWISNPFTMAFMYYGFLVSGYSFFSFLGVNEIEMGFDAFNQRFSMILATNSDSTINLLVECLKFFVFDLGYPMLMGSLFYAIPFSVLSYVLTRKFLREYREGKAKSMGIDYEEWKRRYERR
jgi:uncharacterized protein (DUF2062 family)